MSHHVDDKEVTENFELYIDPIQTINEGQQSPSDPTGMFFINSKSAKLLRREGDVWEEGRKSQKKKEMLGGLEVMEDSHLDFNSTCHVCHKRLSRPLNLKKTFLHPPPSHCHRLYF